MGRRYEKPFRFSILNITAAFLFSLAMVEIYPPFGGERKSLFFSKNFRDTIITMLTIHEIKEYWFKLSDKIRFLLIGGFNAGVSYIIYSVVCLILGEESYQISLAIAWIISSFTSFTTQRCFVFNVKGNLFKQYCKCCTTWVFSYLINAFLLELFVKKLAINVYLAQVAATLTCAVFTYILFKKFAFKRKNNV